MLPGYRYEVAKLRAAAIDRVMVHDLIFFFLPNHNDAYILLQNLPFENAIIGISSFEYLPKIP